MARYEDQEERWNQENQWYAQANALAINVKKGKKKQEEKKKRPSRNSTPSTSKLHVPLPRVNKSVNQKGRIPKDRIVRGFRFKLDRDSPDYLSRDKDVEFTESRATTPERRTLAQSRPPKKGKNLKPIPKRIIESSPSSSGPSGMSVDHDHNEHDSLFSVSIAFQA